MECKSHGEFSQKIRGMYIKLIILLNVINIIFDYFKFQIFEYLN